MGDVPGELPVPRVSTAHAFDKRFGTALGAVR